MKSLTPENLYFDPFAAPEHRFFDASESFDSILRRYTNNEVAHNYRLDDFLKDTEALMLDAQFMGQFNQMNYIASQMHALCLQDHELQQRLSDKNEHAHTFGDTHASDKDTDEKKKKRAKSKKKSPHFQGTSDSAPKAISVSLYELLSKLFVKK
jgi:hypothetical protein